MPRAGRRHAARLHRAARRAQRQDEAGRVAGRRVRRPAAHGHGQDAGVADQRVRVLQDSALFPRGRHRQAEQRGCVLCESCVGGRVRRQDVAPDGQQRRRRVFQRGRRRRRRAGDVQTLEGVSVREAQRPGASDIQTAAQGDGRGEAADGPLSDVPAVSGAYVPVPVPVRVPRAVLPRVAQPVAALVLRAHRFPGRVHQPRTGQTAGRRPGPDPRTFWRLVAVAVRPLGARGQDRRRRRHRVLQEAQVLRRAAGARFRSRLAGVLRQDGRGTAGPDLGRGARARAAQRGGAPRPRVGHDARRGPGRPAVRGTVRPAAGRPAGVAARVLRRARLRGRPVPLRRRLRVRVARPCRGPTVPGRHGGRLRRVRPATEQVQDRDEHRGRRRRRRRRLYVPGIPVGRGHGRGDAGRERVPRAPAAALFRLRTGTRPARTGPIRQDDAARPAPRARRASRPCAQHHRHRGPEPRVRRRVQGVRFRGRRQALLLPPEPRPRVAHRARGRPSHVRQAGRSGPAFCRHANSVQVDRVRGVRAADPRASVGWRHARRMDCPPTPRPPGRGRSQVRHRRSENRPSARLRFHQNVRLTSSDHTTIESYLKLAVRTINLYLYDKSLFCPHTRPTVAGRLFAALLRCFDYFDIVSTVSV